MPALREPNSQPFLFSQTKPTAPETPKSVFAQPAFMTPRKFDLDFSSGAENMSSPENADNDDTPEQPTKTGHRNSLFGMYGRFAPSPGRGEIPRLSHYSNAAARRVQKRRLRNKALDLQVRRDSDDESDRPSSSEGQQKVKHKGGHKDEAPSSPTSTFKKFFTLVEAHPNVPNILSWWAQLALNFFIFSMAGYVLWGIVWTIRAEFDQAAEAASDTILAEMAACAKDYVDNRCGGGDRLPALETVCGNWERCMNRDPAKVGRAKVSAQTMAIIINSFIDPISWKAIVSFITSPQAKLTCAVILSCHYIDRHLRQQLVVPLVQKPLQSRLRSSTPRLSPTAIRPASSATAAAPGPAYSVWIWDPPPG